MGRVWGENNIAVSKNEKGIKVFFLLIPLFAGARGRNRTGTQLSCEGF
jgi:hypothetical protein